MTVRPALWALALAGIGVAIFCAWDLLPTVPSVRSAGSGGSHSSALRAAALRAQDPRIRAGRVWPPVGPQPPLAVAGRAPAARDRVVPALPSPPLAATEPELPRMAIDAEVANDPDALRQFRLDRDDAARVADQLGLVDREAVDRSLGSLVRAMGETEAAFRDRVDDTRRSVFAQAFLTEYQRRLYYQSALFPNGTPIESIRDSIASQMQGLEPEYQTALLPVARATFPELPSEPRFDPDPHDVWSGSGSLAGR